MEAHVQRLHLPHLRVHAPHVARTGIGLAGAVGGFLGGLVMAAPLVFYDWARAGHAALELPSAVTGWLFGLNHFGQNEYRVWPIVIGCLFLVGYWVLHGLAFAGLAERVYRVRTWPGLLALGGAWSFLTFLFFWYVLLAIARDGAPFRLTAAGTGYVAPNWVWIVGYAAFGVATALVYGGLALRRGAREQAQPAAEPAERQQAA